MNLVNLSQVLRSFTGDDLSFFSFFILFPLSSFRFCYEFSHFSIKFKNFFLEAFEVIFIFIQLVYTISLATYHRSIWHLLKRLNSSHLTSRFSFNYLSVSQKSRHFCDQLHFLSHFWEFIFRNYTFFFI